ncbi:hypothetical protein BDR04DRAFT_1121106 [Suillus decipiens]|nr:hypothetical protein BDR04DRAFT_1121106 [Suillus decipiens]
MARSESPIIMPQQTKLPLIKAEIQDPPGGPEEACLQAPTQDKALLKAQKKTYKEWLYNQCCSKAPKPLIKYGKKWTAHCVLIEQNKAWIQEETGEMPGSQDEGLCDVSMEGHFMKTRNWDEIFMPEWQQYAGEQFGLKHGKQQHVIRLFLTQHYRMCMETENIKAVVP